MSLGGGIEVKLGSTINHGRGGGAEKTLHTPPKCAAIQFPSIWGMVQEAYPAGSTTVKVGRVCCLLCGSFLDVLGVF